MRVSTKSRYGLEALVYMLTVYGKQPVSVKRIAGETGISEKYLEQIFLLLRKEGVLTTVRGSHGGFLLAKEPEDVTVGDVMRAIETHIVPVVCVKDLSLCTSRVRDACVTRGLWIRMADEIESIIDAVTLRQLSEDYRAQQEATL